MLAQRIGSLVHTMDSPRFLTLTYRSNPQDLKPQLKFLRRKFAVLRRTPEWKHHVKGGIYTVEITFNSQTSQWHPHIHCIIDGSFWSHSDIVRVWTRVLHDDGGVDIRIVHGIRKIANYLACYISKSCDLDRLPPIRLAEWAVETHALRLCQTFGNLHGTKPSSDQVPISSFKRLSVNVNSIAYKAEQGHVQCEAVLKSLSGKDPCDRPDFMYMIRKAIPPPEPRIVEVKRHPPPPWDLFQIINEGAD